MKVKDIIYGALIALLFIGVWMYWQNSNTNNSSTSPKTSSTIRPETIKKETPKEIEKDAKLIDSIATKEKNSIEATSKPSTKKTVEVKKELPKTVAAKTKKKSTPKKKKVKKAAKIEWSTSTYDFGEITEGDVIQYKFEFKNTGNRALAFLEADASCGCTTPSIPFLDINPGENGYVGVTYNSVNKNGAQKPEIILKTNASPKIHKLYLTGTVKPQEKSTAKKDSIEN